MTELHREEFSLQDALDMFHMPLFVKTSSKCFLKGGFVFDAGVEFTVLQREYVELLFGVDWNGNSIRLNTYEKDDLYVDIVDELYPTSLKELIELLPNISYILPKVLFDPNLARSKLSKKCEIFMLQQNETFEDINKITLISHAGENIYPSLQSLLNKDRFVFVSCKETLTLEILLSRDLTPGMIVRFINGLETQVPYGNIVIEGRHFYDSILTVRSEPESPNKLLYEIFQLDSEIKVFVSDQPIPTHVAEFGKYGSKEYLHKIKELIFTIHYEIYSPRFYGGLVMDVSDGIQVKNIEHTGEVKELSSGRISDWKSVNNSNIVDNKIKEGNVRPTSLFLPSLWNRMSVKKKRNFKKKASSLNTSPMIEEISKLPSFDNVFESPTGNVFDHQSIYPKSIIDDYNDDEIQKVQEEFQERANRRKQSSDILPTKRRLKRNENTSTTDPSFSNETRNEKNSENDLYGFEPSYQYINIPTKESSTPHINKFEKFNGEKMLARSLEEKGRHYMDPGRRRYNTERSPNEAVSPTGTDQSLIRSIDSGIDSPEAKKSEDFIINHFERRKGSESLLEENAKILANQRNLSKSDTSLAGKIEDEEYFYRRSSIDNSESTNELSSEYMSVPYSFVGPRRFTTDMQKREIESLEEIASCSIEDILNRLKGLQLGKFAEKFKKQLINGRLLKNLTEEALREMHFSYFEARKLYKYVHGWRVNIMNCPVNLENSQVKEWSVNDVKKIMKILNLQQLGVFAFENQIDGVLLEDLIRNNYIKTLEKDHGIRLTIVETERLRGYVFKELKYRPHEIIEARLSNRK